MFFIFEGNPGKEKFLKMRMIPAGTRENSELKKKTKKANSFEGIRFDFI